MARPRRPRAARRGRAPRSTGAYATTVGGAGGGELVDAAEEIADGARKNAASWAKTGATVSSIHTEQVDENTVLVVADSGAAYPNETDARHPVFAQGDNRLKWTWVKGNNRPFMAPAAEERAGAAMDKFAVRIDRLAHDRGFK